MMKLAGSRTITRLSRRARREEATAYIFLLPVMMGFVLFTIGPVIAGFVISLTEWDLISPMKFIGFRNYSRLFTLKDPIYFAQAISNTALLSLSAPLIILASLLLGVLVNKQIFGTNFFRTVYYLPVVTATAAVSMAWVWLYDPAFGPLNFVLSKFGIPGPEWLTSNIWALPSIIIMTIWKEAGWGMVIVIAGLQAIPLEYYDAALIDGANRNQRFRYITFPLLTPSLFFLLIMNIIDLLKMFEQVYIMTKGGPAGRTVTAAFYVYANAFEYSKMGIASAGAYTLFVIILIFTLLQFKLQRKWVHYEL